MTERHNPQALARQIASDPKPVLFLDTCIYLDFIRNALNEKFQNVINRLNEYLDRDSIYLIVTDTIANEFQANLPTVSEQLQKRIREVATDAKMLQSLFVLLKQLDEEQPLPNYLMLGNCQAVITLLQDKIADFVSFGCRLGETNESKLKAFERTISVKRPAQRGKDSSGDCLIVESLLELATNLRSYNFSQNVFFVSSNIKDFGGLDRNSLHQDIAIDFVTLDIDFYSQIIEAVWQLN